MGLRDIWSFCPTALLVTTLDVSQYVGQKHLISRCPMHLGIVMIRCERCRSIKKGAPELVRRPLA